MGQLQQRIVGFAEAMSMAVVGLIDRALLVAYKVGQRRGGILLPVFPIAVLSAAICDAQ